jgi:hypothetical protein
MNTINIKMNLLAGMNTDVIPAGERITRITYKAKSKEEVRKNSLGAFIPVVTNDQLDSLIAVPVIKQWIVSEIAKLQDSLIRSYIDGTAYSSVTGVPSTEFDVSAIECEITRQMEASKERTRLSGDSIVTWFKADVAPILAATFAGKLGVTAEDKKVLGIVQAYEDIMKLLAGNSKMEDSQLENLVKCIDLVETNSDMKGRLLARINTLSTPLVIDMMSL